MKYVASIILLIACCVCLLLVAILLNNQARLLTEPGVAQRLKVYFTQNSAHTEAQHRFPELRSVEFQASAERLYRTVQISMIELGWSLTAAEEDSSAGRYLLYGVVTTPVFRFQDDVTVRVHTQTCRQNMLYSVLDIESTSRLGRADLAANAGHIQKLYAQVHLQLSQLPPDPGASVCE